MPNSLFITILPSLVWLELKVPFNSPGEPASPCRNACPLCVCRDHCVAPSRIPEWVTQSDGVKDKLFFQVIHATHLAGRCTGCGECQRACPVGISPKQINMALKARFRNTDAKYTGPIRNVDPMAEHRLVPISRLLSRLRCWLQVV